MHRQHKPHRSQCLCTASDSVCTLCTILMQSLFVSFCFTCFVGLCNYAACHVHIAVPLAQLWIPATHFARF